MDLRRRTFLHGAATATAILAAPGLIGRANAAGFVPESGEPFRPLPEMDARDDFALRATGGSTSFAGGAPSSTKGFESDYLGPTLRMRRGTTVSASVANGTDAPISSHWHGLNVPSNADGGAPQAIVAPGATFRASLPVDQPAATLWYHTHVHGRTAPDVHAGLAGALIVEDELSDRLPLPRTAGVDDLVLVLQDKTFDARGRARYDPGMMGVMHGVVGDTVLVNGQFAPVAKVPRGLVRLRIVNAGTGASMRLSFGGDGHLVATDQGLLQAPIPVNGVSLASGERAEVVLDLRNATSRSVTVEAIPASGMGMGRSMRGGMGGMHGGMTGTSSTDPARDRTLIELRTDPTLPAVSVLPARLAPDDETVMADGPVREFVLATGMGMGNMMRGMLGMQTMTINGRVYDPDRIDFTARRGTTERWKVSGQHMRHPFHAHGVKFRVVDPQRPEETGWKDTVMVDGPRELLVRIEASSVDRVPFMFHCHILEHEDAGMMGQFLVA